MQEILYKQSLLLLLLSFQNKMKYGFLNSYLQRDYLHPKIHKIITGKIQRISNKYKKLMLNFNIYSIYVLNFLFVLALMNICKTSSIANIGYPDNFKPVYYFFSTKRFRTDKRTRHKRKPANKTKIS